MARQPATMGVGGIFDEEAERKKEETVLKSSKLAAAVSDKVNNEDLRRWLEGLNDEDLGRYKM